MYKDSKDFKDSNKESSMYEGPFDPFMDESLRYEDEDDLVDDEFTCTDIACIILLVLFIVVTTILLRTEII